MFKDFRVNFCKKVKESYNSDKMPMNPGGIVRNKEIEGQKFSLRINSDKQ